MYGSLELSNGCLARADGAPGVNEKGQADPDGVCMKTCSVSQSRHFVPCHVYGLDVGDKVLVSWRRLPSMGYVMKFIRPVAQCPGSVIPAAEEFPMRVQWLVLVTVSKPPGTDKA